MCGKESGRCVGKTGLGNKKAVIVEVIQSSSRRRCGMFDLPQPRLTIDAQGGGIDPGQIGEYWQ
jgi:hypothetical protein